MKNTQAMFRIVRWTCVVIAISFGALVLQCGCGSSGAGGDSTSTGTNSITGTVQAPTIGIFGNAAVVKGAGQKALTNAGIANATVCAYNVVTGTKLGCATSDSSGAYTIASLKESEMVDPNATAQARIVIEATASDGQAIIYDYEDLAVATTINAGTANTATTNAFALGTLSEIRKVEASWKPGTAAPTTFTDRLKNATFDPGCKFVPYAAIFADDDVTVSGSGLGGSLGVVDDMLEAGVGRTVWKTLGFSHPADFVYEALNNKLTSAQIATWAAAVATDLNTTAATLEGKFSSAMAVVTSLETVFGSVLASDVGLSSRSGRTSTLCARFKSDATARAKWVDTLAKYSSTSLLEKHWGTTTVFSAAAKFIEESDDDDVFAAFQPEVVIGLLGTEFDASLVTDARVNTTVLMMIKGKYTALTAANKEDLGTDLWRFISNATTTIENDMDTHPAFWIGYLENYYAELISSTNYTELLSDILDDADDVATATCEADPKACATLAGAETPAQAALPTLAGTYATTFGTATRNTCASADVAVCPQGTLTLTQSAGDLTASYAPANGSKSLSGTGTVASAANWTLTISRSETTNNCAYTRSLAMGGVASPFSTTDTTTTITRASTSTANDCVGIINNSLADTGTTCTFTCTTSATKK